MSVKKRVKEWPKDRMLARWEDFEKTIGPLTHQDKIDLASAFFAGSLSTIQEMGEIHGSTTMTMSQKTKEAMLLGEDVRQHVELLRMELLKLVDAHKERIKN